MATYKTPDVYIEEISVFPPSVAEVETCIPAFIGYTQKATKVSNGDLKNVPTRISSMLDYHQYFGGAPSTTVNKVVVDGNNNFISGETKNSYFMYDSLRMFYANGGGDCYIVSVGSYNDTITKGTYANDKASAVGLLGGLGVTEMVDEPTILLFPDAVSISTSSHLFDVQARALQQCNDLQDRFCVFDLHQTDATGANFRNGIGINYLKYGAAYTPWLKVSLPKVVTYESIAGKIYKSSDSSTPVALGTLTTVTAVQTTITEYNQLITDKATITTDMNTEFGVTLKTFRAAIDKKYAELVAAPTDFSKLQALIGALYGPFELTDKWSAAGGNDLTNTTLGNSMNSAVTGTLNTLRVRLIGMDKDIDADSIGAGYTYAEQYSAGSFANTNWTAVGTAPGTLYTGSGLGASSTDADIIAYIAPKAMELYSNIASAFDMVLETVTSAENGLENTLLESFPLYKSIVQGLNDSSVAMPPSGAVLGAYAATDRDRGVWKAPANLSLSSVIGPDTTFTASQLENLNVDSTAGKSINAIRSFTGKGTLIWGARTLAGNDNEWRYVPVRRFFINAEESIKKSTYWAVFEPNNSNTWVKVKGMIENYLTNKWKEGALVGAKPDEAFFVRIGLGQTMSAQDILEGRMNVEIGMAVVRPAEFIILKFSHKLQQS